MPRIYVASLSDYNAGRLHGAWIDLSGKTADDLHGDIRAMLAASPCAGAEEYEIHDYEGFGPLDPHCMSYPDLCDLAAAVDEHGEIALHVLADGHVRYAGEINDYMSDHYAGEFASLEDYAAECVDMTGWPELARRYFDWDGFTRDLELGGDVSCIRLGGKVHVFTA